jgi:sucrose-6-phosphate hydrolase SacC (GH32 family)
MEPAHELKTLRGAMSETANVTVKPNSEFLIPNTHELFDMETVISLGDTQSVTLHIVGQKLEYNAAEKWIALEGIRAPLELNDGKLKLRVVVDRTSIEIFAQDGEVQIAKVFRPQSGVAYTGIAVESFGGGAVIDNAAIWEMQSVWKR